MTQQEVIALLETLTALGRRLEVGLRRVVAAGAGQARYVLLRRADGHADMADELQRERDWLVGTAVVDGRVVPPAALAPVFEPMPPVAMAAASDEELLVEGERTERRAVDAWGEALEQSLPKRLQPLLQAQHLALRRSHRRMQVLLHLARYGNVLLPLEGNAAAPRWPVLLPASNDAPFESVCLD